MKPNPEAAAKIKQKGTEETFLKKVFCPYAYTLY